MANVIASSYHIAVNKVKFFLPSLADWEVSAEEVRAGITAHFVEQYKEVFDVALQYDPADIPKELPDSETSIQN